MRRCLRRALFALLLAAIMLFLLAPTYWALLTSLRAGAASLQTSYWPENPVWSNYLTVFQEQDFSRNILNSTIVALLTVGLSLAAGIFAAHALSRVALAGRRLLLYTILGVSMFPQIAVLSGMFELIRLLQLYDNRLGLALSYLIFSLPFSVWLLTAFMRELPQELEDAAMVDGAGPWTVVLKIFLPLLRPALVTSGLLAFILCWNEFLFALTFTLTDQARTVPVAIALITGASQYELPWGRIMAASVIVTVPVVLLALAFQRRIVAGLTAGSVKG